MIHAGDDWSTRLKAGDISSFYYPLPNRITHDEKDAFYLHAAGEWFYLILFRGHDPNKGESAVTIYDQDGFTYDSPTTDGGWWFCSFYQTEGFDFKRDKFYIPLRYLWDGTNIMRLYCFDFNTKTWSYDTFPLSNTTVSSIVLYPEEDVGYFAYRESVYSGSGKVYVYEIDLTGPIYTQIYGNGSFEGLSFVSTLGKDDTYLYVYAGYHVPDENVYYLTFKLSDFSLEKIYSIGGLDHANAAPGKGYFQQKITEGGDILVLRGDGAYKWNLNSEDHGSGPVGYQNGFIYEITSDYVAYLYLGNYDDGLETKQRFVGFLLHFSSGKVEKLFQKDADNNFDLTDSIIDYNNDISKLPKLILTGGNVDAYSLNRNLYNQAGLNFEGRNPVEIV